MCLPAPFNVGAVPMEPVSEETPSYLLSLWERIEVRVTGPTHETVADCHRLDDSRRPSHCVAVEMGLLRRPPTCLPALFNVGAVSPCLPRCARELLKKGAVT